MSTVQVKPSGNPRSLEEVHSSVSIPNNRFRRFFAFSGPAYLISVGYMDPGNWGTDLSAGAAYKYDLLWIVALASFMAIIMQICSAKLGVVTGKDLAQACRDFYPSWTRWPNWIACELAIAACDLAEVLGSAVALNLLFQIPMLWAVVITSFDVLLLLMLQGLGMRLIEAVILVLVATIAVCYGIEIFVLPQTKPDFLEMGKALINPGFRQEGMVVGAIGIIGATVMPHNLYLHSALVQSRKIDRDEVSIGRAIHYNKIDTILALTLAFTVNAAILILAAIVFHGRDSITLKTGAVVEFNADSDWIQIAHLTLAPLVGTATASFLFAIALLASGQSSTITGTMAGQVVMEGFIHWKLKPWIRRLITRLLAIIPAIIIIGMRGNNGITDLLILSQVVLAMQLPFAMFPLLHFTCSRQRMGNFVNGPALRILGWLSFALITIFALYGLPESFSKAVEVVLGKSEG
ncbi:Nramp family divalent metal transporter [Telmatocola sphagniphila]|uniref:Divalent metal cation transporter MntH n=1 Tax=Telmatocola sphagniphila TaxID=1123043 RepID=A0A8E6B6Q8_9BACT|nr:Nramp family divalent metal transporter [Telmatocola sphagniphila]QVL33120.1 Nramp family divalent metal transporter [Telmatocola sphagniphila]